MRFNMKVLEQQQHLNMFQSTVIHGTNKFQNDRPTGPMLNVNNTNNVTLKLF